MKYTEGWYMYQGLYNEALKTLLCFYVLKKKKNIEKHLSFPIGHSGCRGLQVLIRDFS